MPPVTFADPGAKEDSASSDGTAASSAGSVVACAQSQQTSASRDGAQGNCNRGVSFTGSDYLGLPHHLLWPGDEARCSDGGASCNDTNGAAAAAAGSDVLFSADGASGALSVKHAGQFGARLVQSCRRAASSPGCLHAAVTTVSASEPTWSTAGFGGADSLVAAAGAYERTNASASAPGVRKIVVASSAADRLPETASGRIEQGAGSHAKSTSADGTAAGWHAGAAGTDGIGTVLPHSASAASTSTAANVPARDGVATTSSTAAQHTAGSLGTARSADKPSAASAPSNKEAASTEAADNMIASGDGDDSHQAAAPADTPARAPVTTSSLAPRLTTDMRDRASAAPAQAQAATPEAQLPAAAPASAPLHPEATRTSVQLPQQPDDVPASAQPAEGSASALPPGAAGRTDAEAQSQQTGAPAPAPPPPAAAHSGFQAPVDAVHNRAPVPLPATFVHAGAPAPPPSSDEGQVEVHDSAPAASASSAAKLSAQNSAPPPPAEANEEQPDAPPPLPSFGVSTGTQPAAVRDVAGAGPTHTFAGGHAVHSSFEAAVDRSDDVVTGDSADWAVACPDAPERQDPQANSLITHAMALMLVLSTLAAICWVNQKVPVCAVSPGVLASVRRAAVFTVSSMSVLELCACAAGPVRQSQQATSDARMCSK